jgi:hypothetical protein
VLLTAETARTETATAGVNAADARTPGLSAATSLDALMRPRAIKAL